MKKYIYNLVYKFTKRFLPSFTIATYEDGSVRPFYVKGEFTESSVKNTDKVVAIEIGSAVNIIVPYAFVYYENLKSVVISDSVNTIGVGAFYKCAKLNSVRLPQGLTRIEEDTFLSCEELKDIVIPDTVWHIGATAFCNCYNLKSVRLPEYLLGIYSYTFYGCSSLCKIELPQTLRYIGLQAFGCCISLKTLVIPKSVYHIDEATFYECTFDENSFSVNKDMEGYPWKAHLIQ